MKQRRVIACLLLLLLCVLLVLLMTECKRVPPAAVVPPTSELANSGWQSLISSRPFRLYFEQATASLWLNSKLVWEHPYSVDGNRVRIGPEEFHFVIDDEGLGLVDAGLNYWPMGRRN